MSTTISRVLTTVRPCATATYRLECKVEEFHEIVKRLPDAVISGEPDEPKKIVPKVVKVSPTDFGGFVEIEYPEAFCGLSEGVPQLLNVVLLAMAYRYYNLIRLTDLILPVNLVNSSQYKGPRFGVDGIRKLFEKSTNPPSSRPLVSLALPIAPIDHLKEMARSAAAGGVDFVSDHILVADPDDSELGFEKRVRAIGDAVFEGQAKSGRKTVYIANLTGEMQNVNTHVAYLLNPNTSHHVGGVMLNAFTMGFAAVKEIIDGIDGRLPVFLNMQGNAVMCSNQSSGVDEGILRLFCRLVGGDAVYLSSVGGEYWFSGPRVEYAAPALKEEFGKHKRSFAVATGSINITNVYHNIRAYGSDVILEVGRGIYKTSHPDGPEATAAAIRKAAENITPRMAPKEAWETLKKLRDLKTDEGKKFDYVCREFGLDSEKHFGFKDETPLSASDSDESKSKKRGLLGRIQGK